MLNIVFISSSQKKQHQKDSNAGRRDNDVRMLIINDSWDANQKVQEKKERYCYLSNELKTEEKLKKYLKISDYILLFDAQILFLHGSIGILEVKNLKEPGHFRYFHEELKSSLFVDN